MIKRILVAILLVGFLSFIIVIAQADTSVMNVDGEQTSLERYINGRQTLVIFGRTVCGNTNALLSGLTSSRKRLSEIGINVVAVMDTQLNNPTAAELKSFSNQYAGFTILKILGSTPMWDWLRTFEPGISSISYPVTFIRSASGELLGASMGYIQDITDYLDYIDSSLNRNPSPKNGLTKDDDDIWRYYENDKFVAKTGIVEYEGGQFFVANGVLCSTANGLNEFGGQWYFLAGGQVQAQQTGLAEYGGEWFYIDKGILDINRRGIVNHDGGQFMIAAGRILREANGLIQDPNTGIWYFVSAGQVAANYRGLALYDEHWFYVWDGVFQSDAEGWVDHDGATFYVIGGMIQTDSELHGAVPEETVEEEQDKSLDESELNKAAPLQDEITEDTAQVETPENKLVDEPVVVDEMKNEPADQEPPVEETAAQDETEDEPVVDEVPAEPVVEETSAEPVVDETPAEPAANEAPAEPAAGEVPAELAADEAPAEPTIEVSEEPAVEEAPADPVADETPAEPAAQDTPAEEPVNTEEADTVQDIPAEEPAVQEIVEESVVQDVVPEKPQHKCWCVDTADILAGRYFSLRFSSLAVQQNTVSAAHCRYQQHSIETTQY